MNSNPVGAITRSESRKGGFGDVEAVCRPSVDATIHNILRRGMRGVDGGDAVCLLCLCANFMS
jgi:hypothetical protein